MYIVLQIDILSQETVATFGGLGGRFRYEWDVIKPPSATCRLRSFFSAQLLGP
jgi:hypothetical protein